MTVVGHGTAQYDDAKAERQRRRAPEPGPVEPEFEPIPKPSRRVGQTAQKTGYASLGCGFWIVTPILVTLGIVVDARILWIGMIAYGLLVGMTRK
jgi:hypothetical protein